MIEPADLRAAADILDRHPCEAYMLNRQCREAADEIEGLRSDRDTYNGWATEIRAGVEELRADNERLRAKLRDVLNDIEHLEKHGPNSVDMAPWAYDIRQTLGLGDEQSSRQTGEQT